MYSTESMLDTNPLLYYFLPDSPMAFVSIEFF